jgi:hypothetical protein
MERRQLHGLHSHNHHDDIVTGVPPPITSIAANNNNGRFSVKSEVESLTEVRHITQRLPFTRFVAAALPATVSHKCNVSIAHHLL